MNWKTWIIAIVLLHFAALTAYSMQQVGYLGIWQAGLANWGARQVLADLLIVCTLAMIWMALDARGRGLNPWPYLLLTVFAGSFGPLLYLLRREWGAPRTALHAAHR
jgi:hypothetical protein